MATPNLWPQHVCELCTHLYLNLLKATDVNTLLHFKLIGMVMVTRDWLRDSRSIRAAFRHLKTPYGTGKRVWLVTFLEGTRKTEAKLLQVIH